MSSSWCVYLPRDMWWQLMPSGTITSKGYKHQLLCLLLFGLRQVLLPSRDSFLVFLKNTTYFYFYHIPWWCVGTLKALSKTSVPPRRRRWILGTQVLILSVYTIVLLSYVVVVLLLYMKIDKVYCLSLLILLELFIALNPLFDLLIYVCMRKDVKKIFREYLSLCFSEVTWTTTVTYKYDDKQDEMRWEGETSKFM